MKTKKYLIANIGCDDTTYTELSLNENELKILIRFAKENNKTAEGCMPIIRIYENYTKRDGWFEYSKSNDLVEKVEE